MQQPQPQPPKPGAKSSEFWAVVGYGALIFLGPQLGIPAVAGEQLWASATVILGYALGRSGVKIMADMSAAKAAFKASIEPKPEQG